ncbi:hypothetical protein LQR31_08820, partial [Chromobacterium vaccinii]|uniref:hypothetical protein n=1 Tax=Chromobacterium vaccinii TaxID=1108595 RepID=UPI001E3F4325
MAKPYATPGVYVTEVSTLPPSVVQVPTAIPAFIGNVVSVFDDAGNVVNTPVFPIIRRITSIADYERYFGGPALLTGEVIIKVDDKVKRNPINIFFKEMALESTAADAKLVKGISAARIHALYYALQHFFANGGGIAYVAATSKTSPGLTDGTAQTIGDKALKAVLDELEKVDEVTLLLAPEFAAATDYATNAAQPLLAHAAKLGDRFALIDAPNSIKPNDAGALSTWRSQIIGTVDTLKYGAAYYPWLATPLQAQPSADNVKVATEIDTIKIETGPDGKTTTTVVTTRLDEKSLSTFRNGAAGSQLEAQVLSIIAQQTLTLPPSAAIAGVYAQTDAARGVWKAPANVPLAAVNGPAIVVTAKQQEAFNVDAVSG